MARADDPLNQVLQPRLPAWPSDGLGGGQGDGQSGQFLKVREQAIDTGKDDTISPLSSRLNHKIKLDSVTLGQIPGSFRRHIFQAKQLR